jgi:hypothetical protein
MLIAPTCLHRRTPDVLALEKPVSWTTTSHLTSVDPQGFPWYFRMAAELLPQLAAARGISGPPIVPVR